MNRHLKNTLIILVEALLFTLFGFLFIENNLVVYGLKMGKGQMHIVLNTRSIEACLDDPTFQDSLKEKLKLTLAVRKFAIDSLGLNNSKNFTQLYDQQNKPAIWVVTATAPYALKPKLWHFPFLGDVPYKGFFVRAEADSEQAHLIKAGYDTKLGTTSAWSTLGWFKDPLLSNVLYASEGSIAELIIHELTHATIFIKDSVAFNENLASFIGEMGARRYLIATYGINSKQYIQYTQAQADEMTYTSYILNATKKLNHLYLSINNLKVSEKEVLKMNLIDSIVSGVDTLPLHNRLTYIKRSQRALKARNAYFMEYIRYDGKRPYLMQALTEKYKGDLRKFIKSYCEK